VRPQVAQVAIAKPLSVSVAVQAQPLAVQVQEGTQVAQPLAVAVAVSVQVSQDQVVQEAQGLDHSVAVQAPRRACAHEERQALPEEVDALRQGLRQAHPQAQVNPSCQ